MNEPNFGARLRARREAVGLTLDELAQRVGTTKSYVWEIENKAEPRVSADLLFRIAKELKTTMEQLVTGRAPRDSATEVFFRDYSELKPTTKRRLQKIMDALKDDE